MLALALLALPALALDLAVTYTVSQAVDPGSSAPVSLSLRSRSWTFHDVELTQPPAVLIEYPDDRVCRMVTEVALRGEDQVTVAMLFQRMEVIRGEVRWRTIASPRVTTAIGQALRVEQETFVPALVEGETRMLPRTAVIEVVPLE